jgi:3-oxoacyl-[acyl-carrier protein] reductase
MDRLQDDASLVGRRSLVVGGSGGIGRALSLELGRRGSALIVHGGSSREGLDSTLRELRQAGAEAEGFLEALGGSAGCVRRFVDLLPSLGRIDLLVVALGPFVRKSLAATEAEDWERLALLDLALPGALCSSLLPGMIERGWGRILLFGGTRTDGVRAYKSNAAYASAKTGLSVLVKSLAAESSASGVASVLVCPGFVDTEYLSEAERDALRARAPGGRLIDSGELAHEAVGMIAREPCMASGSIVCMDGGLCF